jgi:manganese transport protein
VQARGYGATLPDKREAPRFAIVDPTVAPMFALCVKAAILISAAIAFHRSGRTAVAKPGDAHRLLAPRPGAAAAPTRCAIALLARGLTDPVTAIPAGQAAIKGFFGIRLRPWLRCLVAQAIAIAAAGLVTIWHGDAGTTALLILTPLVLSRQQSFAVLPLVMVATNRPKMDDLAAPAWLGLFAAVIAALIVVPKLKRLWDFVTGG